jgi:hypothetical protein
MKLDSVIVDLFLEVVNGWLFILGAAVVTCLVVYMRWVRTEFNMTWIDVVSDKTRQGLKLAKPLFLFVLGCTSLWLVAWFWRVLGDGTSMPLWQFHLFVAAVGMITFGGLLLIRLFTWRHSGEWAWMYTMLTLFVYTLIHIVLY